MKKAVRILLIGLWVILATIGLTFVLVRSKIDERLSESSVVWLYTKFDLLGIEDYQNLVIDVFLGLSFIVVSLLTLLGCFFLRRIKAR